MRKIGFETSKGKYLLIDDNNDWFCGLKFNYYGDAKYDFFPKDENSDDYFSYVKKYKLSEIPEEQASEIVDYPFELEVADYSVLVFKDYEDDENTYTSSIDSLYSLLKSKGIHLFKNPFNIENCFEPNYYEKKLQAEQKTFYNPYIFKI